MRIDAVATGQNPPYDVNAIVEIPVGGVPIKHELDKAAGVLVMQDEQGLDEKILVVPHDELSPYCKYVSSYRDLPQIQLERIGHFCEHYKDLEKDKWVKVVRWGEAEEAHEFIRKAITRAAEEEKD